MLMTLDAIEGVSSGIVSEAAHSCLPRLPGGELAAKVQSSASVVPTMPVVAS